MRTHGLAMEVSDVLNQCRQCMNGEYEGQARGKTEGQVRKTWEDF